MKKFALHPGFIKSIKDGDMWKVTYKKLIELYDLNPYDCIIWDEQEPKTFKGRKYKDYIHLYPQRRAEVYNQEKENIKKMKENS